MEVLRDINAVSIALRIALAIVVGGILGFERERKNRPAGFRTYMLVCVGATLVMMTNQYVFQQFGASDPVRMGAQVVSGIGFLGAGTIIVTGKNKIKGITTAAGLWTAACCGLAIGIGFYEAALIGGVSILLIVAVLPRLDRRIRRHTRYTDLYIEFEPHTLFSHFISYCKENGIELSDIHFQKENTDAATTVMLTVNSKEKLSKNQLVELVGEAPGIRFIEELCKNS